MATYVVLVNFTEQGIRGIKEIPERWRAVDQLAQQHGGKVTALYLTMGAYDAVGVLEAPDDEAVARVMLTIGMRGNVRTTTLRAYPRAEAEKLAQSLG